MFLKSYDIFSDIDYNMV